MTSAALQSAQPSSQQLQQLQQHALLNQHGQVPADAPALLQQNEQLWRLIERQRGIIFQLRDELDRMLKEKQAGNAVVPSTPASTMSVPTSPRPAQGLALSIDPKLANGQQQAASAAAAAEDDASSVRSAMSVRTNDTAAASLATPAKDSSAEEADRRSVTAGVATKGDGTAAPQKPPATRRVPSMDGRDGTLSRPDGAGDRNSSHGPLMAHAPRQHSLQQQQQQQPQQQLQPPPLIRAPSQSQLSHLRTTPHLMTLPVRTQYIRTAQRGKEVLTFVITVRQLAPPSSSLPSGAAIPYQDLWFCEKTFADFVEFEALLKPIFKTSSQAQRPTKLPDKSLFSASRGDYNLDFRFDILETFLKQVLVAVCEFPFLPILNPLLEFITTNLVPPPGAAQPSTPTKANAPGPSSAKDSAPTPDSSPKLPSNGALAPHLQQDESTVSRLFKKASHNTMAPNKVSTFFGGRRHAAKKGSAASSSSNANKASGPVFGIPLEVALALANCDECPDLPAVMYRCIKYLEEHNAKSEEGIYRLSGSTATIRALRDKFNTDGDYDIVNSGDYYDPHAVAGLLKLFLRELPESILTTELRSEFTVVIDLPDRTSRVCELARLVDLLPPPNYSLLRALIAHLLTIVQNSDVNKMNVRNLGIVFAPTLGIAAGVFSLLITDFNEVFDKETASQGRLRKEQGSAAAPAPQQQQLQPQPPAAAAASASAPVAQDAKRNRRSTFISAAPPSPSSFVSMDEQSLPPPPPAIYNAAAPAQDAQSTTTSDDQSGSPYQDQIGDLMADYDRSMDGTEVSEVIAPIAQPAMQQHLRPVERLSDDDSSSSRHRSLSRGSYPSLSRSASVSRSINSLNVQVAHGGQDADAISVEDETPSSNRPVTYLNYYNDAEGLDYLAYLEETGGKRIATPQSQLAQMQQQQQQHPDNLALHATVSEVHQRAAAALAPHHHPHRDSDVSLNLPQQQQQQQPEDVPPPRGNSRKNANRGSVFFGHEDPSAMDVQQQLQQQQPMPAAIPDTLHAFQQAYASPSSSPQHTSAISAALAASNSSNIGPHPLRSDNPYASPNMSPIVLPKLAARTAAPPAVSASPASTAAAAAAAAAAGASTVASTSGVSSQASSVSSQESSRLAALLLTDKEALTKELTAMDPSQLMALQEMLLQRAKP